MSQDSLTQRLQILSELSRQIQSREEKIYEALHEDLRKPRLESYASEIAPVLEEIHHARTHLKKWSRKRRVFSPPWKLAHWLSRSWIQPEPLGNVLILAPWNYPFHLSLAPVVGALAAGNHVHLKPSEFSPHTSQIIAEIFAISDLRERVTVHLGDKARAQELLQQDWEHIFFTGSTAVGRVVMRAAAERLTPVTLELGGKCPAVFDYLASDLDTALKRLLWGKTFNAGQTCVAPDFAIFPSRLRSTVLKRLPEILESFFGADPQKSSSYGRIINSNHHARLVGLLENQNIIYGGHHSSSDLYLAPTLVEAPLLDSPLMQEEIFGPILPLFFYDHEADLEKLLRISKNPLATYLFSQDKKWLEKWLPKIPSGGACLNDTIVHLGNPRLPFGGRRSSGLGSYHGFESFRIFSHWRSVEWKSLKGDIPLRYAPYKINPTSFWKKFI